MNFSIPILVQRLFIDGEKGFQVSPIFFPDIQYQNVLLERALNQLNTYIRQELNQRLRNSNHDKLQPWTFSPEFDEHRLQLAFSLRNRTIQTKFLILTFEQMGTRYALHPQIPDFWFKWPKKSGLNEVSSSSLRHYFKTQEKEGNLLDPNDYSCVNGQSILQLDLNLRTPVPKKKKKKRDQFSIGGNQELADGLTELNHVGRCLDALYPNGLKKAILRDQELHTLSVALKSKENRPVLVVGSPKVGKTSIIHQFIFNRNKETKTNTGSLKNRTWLLSPQRLVSGMKYVGQWEDRLLAILKESRKSNLILYFDDLLGLLQAGKTSDSDLCMADVIRQELLETPFRLLAEITPEAFRVLQEKDRSFADLFYVVRINEPSSSILWRMLIVTLRELEGRFQCIFNPDILPLTINLHHRHQNEYKFPGKAANFLFYLADKYKGRSITREIILSEFSRKTGIHIDLIDEEEKISTEEIETRIRHHLKGQSPAVAAIGQRISLFKAGLHDLNRPLGTFLFLGPTGVGKTQCAKAVASCLLGSIDSLLRFDMNEFNSSDSVDRLIGSFHNPDGILTSAIQRNPFSVLLLDEIEKAHWKVIDLLLQVLGEGRLTDARGRTVSFTHSIIILTSNLGVHEAENQVGFSKKQTTNDSTYLKAVRDFFRPEFFNRLDEIIPFQYLSRDELEDVSSLLVQDILRRHGLQERQTHLKIIPGALKWIIDQGYQPQFGARALKRTLERYLTSPISEQLVRQSPYLPNIITLFPKKKSIGVEVKSLEIAKYQPYPHHQHYLQHPHRILSKIKQFLRIKEKSIETVRPNLDTVTEGLTIQQDWYFSLKEMLHEIKEHLNAFQQAIWEEKNKAPSHSSKKSLEPVSHAKPRHGDFAPSWFPSNLFQENPQILLSKWKTNPYLKKLLPEKSSSNSIDSSYLGKSLESYAIDLLNDSSLLHSFISTPPSQEEHFLFMLRGSAFHASLLETMGTAYISFFNSVWGCECRELPFTPTPQSKNSNQNATKIYLLEGFQLSSLFTSENGCFLWDLKEETALVHLSIYRLNSEELNLFKKGSPPSSSTQNKKIHKLISTHIDQHQSNTIIRVSHRDGSIFDFKTGFYFRSGWNASMLAQCLLTPLPLSSELEIASNSNV